MITNGWGAWVRRLRVTWGRRWGYGRPAEERDEPLSTAACGQPGRLVAVVARGVRGGPRAGRARDAVGRLLGLSLVPRDGPRVVRGSANCGAAERQPRADQGGPRGTARRGRGVHDRDPGHDRPGR